MQQNHFFTLEEVIDPKPLTVNSNAPLIEVVRLMQEWGNSCRVADDFFNLGNSSCVLVVENSQLQGIFTERDLVKLIAAETDTERVTVAEVMTQDLVTLTPNGTQDIFTVLNILRSQNIRHLPVVDNDDNVLGLITAKNLRRKLQPINMMKWRKVKEIMETEVVYATPDDSVRHLAQLMTEGNSSYVAIAKSKLDPTNNRTFVHPIGIVTERDIVQFQNLNLDLKQPARNIMSAPLFLIDPEDTLWLVKQQMEQHRVRRLLVGSEKEELIGIVTQTSLLQVFDPSEMYEVIETLQQQLCQLESERTQLLESRQAELEQEVKERTADIEHTNQRLQLEAHLRQENQRRFDSILASLNDIIWSADARTLKLIYINQAAENIYGYPVAEFYRNENLWLEAVHPEDRDRVSEFPQRALETGTQEMEYRIVRPDGEVRWLLDRANLTYDADNKPLRLDGNSTDITQSKQAEALLKESQERYTLAVEGSRDGLWDWNIITNEVFYAPRFKAMIGYTDEEMPNVFETWSSKLHQEDRKTVLAAVQNHLEDRVTYDVEYRLQTKQGHYCWFNARGQAIWDENGKAIRMAGSISDISDRKRREEILKDIASGMSVRAGEKFLPSLVEYLSKTLLVDFVCVGELIDSNRGIIKTLVVYEGDQIGKNFEYPLAGAPCENVVGKEFCLYPETIQQLFPQDLYLQQVGAESYAGIPLYKSDGTVFGLIAILHSQPMRDIDLIEEVLKIFASRITTELERQQGESRLKQSEQKFRGIFNQTFQFTGLLTPEGTLLEANQNSLDFIGATLSDVVGKPFWSTPWWSLSSEIQQQLRDAIAIAANGELVRYEVEHTGVDGQIITVDFSLKPLRDETGKVMLLIPESRDISDRKQAEAKNREQAALLDVATDAIIVRGLNNRLLFWNKGAEKLYGWTQSEALNRDVSELLYRISPNRLEEIQQAVRKNGEWQGELKQVTKTGREITVESRWTLVKNEVGEPKFYLVVNTDITEQKQLEAQFLRTQRLESLGTLAGGIAHDLNNILAPIMGFAKLLPLKLPDVDEQTKGFFKIMENNANRGSALVRQILTFSRGLEGDRGIVQIRHLINEIGQIITETFPKTIELDINAPKNLWTVNADVNQLHQVLMNLSVNARDAMSNGGTLTIKAENRTVDADYAKLHLDAKEGDYLLITVTDTGMGIPAEIIDRIFEPFFTTKEIGRGTGLGLSTAIGIIKSHDGFVEVMSNSENTKGTQFQVYLPASDTAAATEKLAEIPQGNGELVLVVDDESAILEVTKATLETYNYRVLTASNGIEAIAIYAQNQPEINLVIMDIMMPTMDGKTAILTLKQIDPDIKIIAVSGLIDRQEIIDEVDNNISAYLAKPYTNEDLLIQVDEIVSS